VQAESIWTGVLVWRCGAARVKRLLGEFRPQEITKTKVIQFNKRQSGSFEHHRQRQCKGYYHNGYFIYT